MFEMIPGKSGFSHPPTPQILTVISGCEGGGYHPAITLSRMLHNDFYSVRLLCDQETTSAAVESGIPSYILPATCSAGNFYIGKINQLLKDRARIYEKTENPLVVWAEKAAAILQNDNDFPPPDLIISSLLCQPLASLLGRQFGVPWIFVNPAFSYLAHSHCNWQLDFSLTGAEMYQHWLLPFTQKADLIVHATDPLFDNSDPIVSEKEFYIGPLFHEQKPPPTLPTLPEDCPCVIASISTSPQPREQQLLERIIEAGDVIRHPVILTTTKSSPPLHNLPSHMIATAYYPHSPLLANCCYHICHGGHGTVLKAMAAGIPMIIVPLGRDQPGVARRAKQRGSAIIISDKTCNRRTLVAAITELETNSQYARNAEAYAAKLRNSHVSADGYLRLRTFIASVIQSQK